MKDRKPWPVRRAAWPIMFAGIDQGNNNSKRRGADCCNGSMRYRIGCAYVFTSCPTMIRTAAGKWHSMLFSAGGYCRRITIGLLFQLDGVD